MTFVLDYRYLVLAGKDIAQAFKTMVGEELIAYNKMMNEARAIAYFRNLKTIYIQLRETNLTAFYNAGGKIDLRWISC